MTRMADTTRGRIDGWGVYLLLLVFLIPVVVPSGPGRLAIVDGLIFLGLLGFAARIMGRREPVRVPYMVPVFMISLGSLVAMVGAINPGASVLAIAQDAYLFAFFIMLVHLMRNRDLTPIQKTWMWAGNLIALYGLFVLVTTSHTSILDMVRPKGRRLVSTFYDPNMAAGYLVMCLFFTLSLGKRVPLLLRWGSIGLMLLGIVASKSNGGALSLIVGLAVWVLMRARTRRSPPLLIGAAAFMAVCVALLAVWLTAGLGVGSAELSSFEENSFLARASHSSEGRFTIWKNLEDTYRHHPLGIGPGNSSSLTVSVAQRLRPGSLQAKEAHNDYLAYAIERGPLGISGLLLLLAAAFTKLFVAARPPDAGSAREPANDALGSLVAAAAGALAASAVHGLTIEVLHFRHFWMLMAMVCVIDAMAKGERAESRSPAEHPVMPPPVRVAAA
jgi:O-antigen ligase